MTSKRDQTQLDIGDAVRDARRTRPRPAVERCPCGQPALPGSHRRRCLRCSAIAAERSELYAAFLGRKSERDR